MSDRMKQLREGVREDGTIEGCVVETYLALPQPVLSAQWAFRYSPTGRFVAFEVDNGATDLEVRIPFEHVLAMAKSIEGLPVWPAPAHAGGRNGEAMQTDPKYDRQPLPANLRGSTPGPWFNDGDARIQGNADGHRYDIARLCAVPFHVWCEPDGPSVYGNARLLAAAPEFRAMLKKHHDWHLSRTDVDPVIGQSPADAYAESALCEETLRLLSMTPEPATT